MCTKRPIKQGLLEEDEAKDIADAHNSATASLRARNAQLEKDLDEKH